MEVFLDRYLAMPYRNIFQFPFFNVVQSFAFEKVWTIINYVFILLLSGNYIELCNYL